MRKLTHPIIVVLNRVQSRMVRSRPGSVLILVVVLVVLLALMGTALLSTTRSDRFIAAQHTVNTQVDLIVEGVVQMVKGTLLDSLSGDVGTPPAATHKFRPAVAEDDVTSTYADWTYPDLNTS